MANDNAEQIAEWNGALGQRWAEWQAELNLMASPFGSAALDAAAPRVGERVIDVGCGCGDTSIQLARAVGSEGRVLGIDVSSPMLTVARASAEREHVDNVAFLEADASQAPLPDDTDLVYSRFGTMFFCNPAMAFARLRASLRPGGRMVFVCWRTPRDNDWAMTPLSAARRALGIEAVPSDPDAPGPFAFADADRVRALLSEAAFENIQIKRFDASIWLGRDARSAAENALRIGPTSRLAREAGTEHRETIRQAVEAALAARAAEDGSVRLNGSTWIVSAEQAARA